MNLMLSALRSANGAMPRGLIFDMDGTIADNMQFHLNTWGDFLIANGFTFEREIFLRDYTGCTGIETIRSYFGHGLSEAEVAQKIQAKEALYRTAYAPHMRPVNGLLTLLGAANDAGIPCAIGTAGDQSNVQYLLGGLGLLPHFSAVVSAEDVREGKPSPEVFLIAAARLQVPAKDCVVFEDSLHGVEAAKRAGMRTVAITTSISGSEFRRHFPKPDDIVICVPDYAALTRMREQGA